MSKSRRQRKAQRGKKSQVLAPPVEVHPAQHVESQQPAPHTNVASVQQYSETTSVHAGPLPTPDDLAAYEAVAAGAAERIITMAEKQADHRRDLESRVVRAGVRQSTFGQVSAVVVSMFTIGGGFYLILQDKSTLGMVSIVSVLVGLVGVFVYGRHSQEREREQKMRVAAEHD